jgi:hypothetical protein
MEKYNTKGIANMFACRSGNFCRSFADFNRYAAEVREKKQLTL